MGREHGFSWCPVSDEAGVGKRLATKSAEEDEQQKKAGVHGGSMPSRTEYRADVLHGVWWVVFQFSWLREYRR